MSPNSDFNFEYVVVEDCGAGVTVFTSYDCTRHDVISANARSTGPLGVIAHSESY